MSTQAPDTYEEALEHALHVAGMTRADHVAQIERENMALRAVLKESMPFLPKWIHDKASLFFPNQKKP